MYDIQKIRSDFPILSRQVNGKPLTYLDNGASAQKPQVVIDAVTRAYAEEYANVHRGLHYLSNLATEKYESVRGIVARFLGAANQDDIVLNTGSTIGINTVAYGWAMPHLQAGDEIILSVMEHHANIVPCTFVANLVKNKASSIAESPPPTTATVFSLKKKPSHVAHAETPYP